MPDLATIAKPFPAQLNMTSPGGGPFTLPWACHAATCAWLYEAAFSRPVTGAEYNSFFLNAQPIMTNLAETHGGQVKALSDIGVGTLAPRGTLLVFYDSSGLRKTAGHSCVMKTSHYIVGYNQEGWFTGQGVNHGFSMHSTSEICWVGGGDVSNRTATQHYSLLAVSEQHAIEFIRRLVIGELRRFAYEEFFKPVKFS